MISRAESFPARYFPRLALALILILALALRLIGIDFELPYIYHPDEPRYILSAQLLFKTLDINPNHLPDISSSSFVYVVNALAYVPYYATGKLLGKFESRQDIAGPAMEAMGTGYTSQPKTFLLGRGVSVAFGTLTVLMVYMIGCALLERNSRPVGLLAALLMAVYPTGVFHSKFITPDTLLTFWIVFVFFFTVRIWKEGRWPNYLLAGVGLGFVIATKINGVLIGLPLLVAHFSLNRAKGFSDPRIYACGAIAAAAFLFANPYIFGDANKVLADILLEGRHYATGHAGMEGDSLRYYLMYAWQSGALLPIFAVLEIARAWILPVKDIRFLSIYPVVYFLFISSFIVRNDRTFLPLAPFLLLLAASFIFSLLEKARELRLAQAFPVARAVLIGIFVGVLLIAPVKESIAGIPKTVESRREARTWISNNLPVGSKIMIEPYSPFIDPQRYDVHSVPRMISKPAEFYSSSDFDYLVFSQGMYGRFFLDPERYTKEVAEYNNIFSRFDLVKRFWDGSYEIRVYRVR